MKKLRLIILTILILLGCQDVPPCGCSEGRKTNSLGRLYNNTGKQLRIDDGDKYHLIIEPNQVETFDTFYISKSQTYDGIIKIYENTADLLIFNDKATKIRHYIRSKVDPKILEKDQKTNGKIFNEYYFIFSNK